MSSELKSFVHIVDLLTIFELKALREQRPENGIG